MAEQLISWVKWAMDVLEGSGQRSTEPVVDESTGIVSWTVTTDDGRKIDLTAKIPK